MPSLTRLHYAASNRIPSLDLVGKCLQRSMNMCQVPFVYYPILSIVPYNQVSEWVSLFFKQYKWKQRKGQDLATCLTFSERWNQDLIPFSKAKIWFSILMLTVGTNDINLFRFSFQIFTSTQLVSSCNFIFLFLKGQVSDIGSFICEHLALWPGKNDPQ